MAQAADQLTTSETDAERLLIHAYASPLERGGEVIDRLDARTPKSTDDPLDLLLLGHAAACVGAFSTAETYCVAASKGLREQGRLAPLSEALSLVAWAALRRSRWHVAAPAAHECVRLAEDTRQPIVQLAGLAALAMIASIRGDVDATVELTAKAEQLGMAHRVSVGLALIEATRAMAAAGAGRSHEAYDHLSRLYRQGEPAHQRMQACWAIGSLAEVAAQCGEDASASEQLAALESLTSGSRSAGVLVALRYARAVLAGPDDAEGRYRDALDGDLSDWPFEHGRLQLSYGRWLRRQHRVLESRAPLRSACDRFDLVGAQPWADAARSELRAAGEFRSAASPEIWEALSPQELNVAQLVAEGLSNREIGERMYLSHRTISSHLYRIFPKLGVTSRNQLANLMNSVPSPAHD